MRAPVLALVLSLAAPAAAGASTVSVEPFREPADLDPFGSCMRLMTCPADMVVLSAASGEANHVTIAETVLSAGRTTFLVRDRLEPVVAGAGCERVAEPAPATAVVCTAGAIGPVRLGDGDDWITSPDGWVSGGSGDDELTVDFGSADGGAGNDVLLVDTGEADGQAGDDVVIGGLGAGGRGHDRLIVENGRGGPGRDILSCTPQKRSGCFLDGGAGDDRIDARQPGGRARRDRVDCGTGRDRAAVDRRDTVKRCERVARGRRR